MKYSVLLSSYLAEETTYKERITRILTIEKKFLHFGCQYREGAETCRLIS